MRNLKLIPLLGILAISLLVSSGSVQSVSAAPGRKAKHFWYTVYVLDGSATSSLEWLVGCYPIEWWPDSPYYNDRGLQGTPPYPGCPFPPAEYLIDDRVFVCQMDWVMECVLYPDSAFRSQVWIFWDPDEVVEPGARSLGGYFIFSHGSGAFDGMWAFGKAWVEMEPGKPFPFAYQYHVGLMFGGP